MGAVFKKDQVETGGKAYSYRREELRRLQRDRGWVKSGRLIPILHHPSLLAPSSCSTLQHAYRSINYMGIRQEGLLVNKERERTSSKRISSKNACRQVRISPSAQLCVGCTLSAIVPFLPRASSPVPQIPTDPNDPNCICISAAVLHFLTLDTRINLSAFLKALEVSERRAS